MDVHLKLAVLSTRGECGIPGVEVKFVDIIIEIGQYYAGAASVYQKKDNIFEFEYGLNAYVNLGTL